MIKLIYKYPVITLIIVCVILFFFNLGVLPVSIMEARNFNVAREMLTENNWLLTTMNAIPRYESRPFLHGLLPCLANLTLNRFFYIDCLRVS